MKQGVLPFQYEEEKKSTGMTALSGLAAYLELAHTAGLRSSVERHVGLREGGQGWTDSQMITSLALLNLVGGESVVDLYVLEIVERWRGDGAWGVGGSGLVRGYWPWLPSPTEHRRPRLDSG